MPRAVVMRGAGERVVVGDFDRPTLQCGAVLLETIYSDVCGTDCHLFHGRLAGVPYPIIPGHVSVGRIAEMNGEVHDVDGRRFEIGDVVTFLDVHETCGQCWFCLVAKATTRCPKRRVYGITYSADEGLLGGWSEAIYLKPGVKILRLPENVSPQTFISGGCGLPTAFHAVDRATLRMGDTVVVQGSGPVGLCAVALARLAGAGHVTIVGAPDQRLDLAVEFGADEAVSIERTTPEERVERVRGLTGGRGADVCIEASGSPAAVVEGMELTRDNGTYVIVGQYTDCGSVQINPHVHINRKHLDIRGCWGSDFSHVYRALIMMSRSVGTVPWEKMITRHYTLDEAGQALEDVERLRVVKAVIEP